MEQFRYKINTMPEQIELNDTSTMQEIDAIKQLVEDAAKYQNDPDLFLPLHANDVVIVNFAGRRVLGRNALEHAMRKALSGQLAKVVTTNVVENIIFLRSDVALVNCIKHVADNRDSIENGAALPSEKGALTYILVKGKEGWKISLAQTTPMITL
jgi:uncharacterized protein (TIGR02246 family)